MNAIVESKSYVLGQGLTHGVVGPNGIGKTTLLRKIAGQQPSKGLKVFGQEPFDNRAVMDLSLIHISEPTRP